MFFGNKKRTETTQYQLTKRFIYLFLSLLLAMNIIYLIAASSFVYEFLENKAMTVYESINVQNKKGIDWEQQINTIVSPKDEDGLVVTTSNNERYYSSKSKELFEELYIGKSLPFVPKLIFSDEGIYYVTQQKYDTFTVQLAINSETAVELVYGMFMISLVLNLLAVLIGSLLIYRSVKNWSSELNQMSEEIRTLDDGNRNQLSIPEQPIEMKEVAMAFNELLHNKEASIEREKQFITDASHDLKTPIAAIRGHVQLIQRRGESHPEIILKSLSFIDSESQRLEKLSRQLLELNKGRDELKLEEISLSQLVREEVEKSHSIHLREFDTKIENDVTLVGIRSELQQVVQNLIENAIKYSKAETKTTVILETRDNNIYLEIADEGIGISDTDKPHIFERFYRADTSRTSKVEGSGVGLSIVKKNVEYYGGSIKVEDNHPQGSKFIVLLPR